LRVACDVGLALALAQCDVAIDVLLLLLLFCRFLLRSLWLVGCQVIFIVDV
jgi:hypothetical protein